MIKAYPITCLTALGSEYFGKQSFESKLVLCLGTKISAKCMDHVPVVFYNSCLIIGRYYIRISKLLLDSILIDRNYKLLRKIRAQNWKFPYTQTDTMSCCTERVYIIYLDLSILCGVYRLLKFQWIFQTVLFLAW